MTRYDVNSRFASLNLSPFASATLDITTLVQQVATSTANPCLRSSSILPSLPVQLLRFSPKSHPLGRVLFYGNQSVSEKLNDSCDEGEHRYVVVFLPVGHRAGVNA